LRLIKNILAKTAKIGNSISGDYSEFEADGTLKFNGGSTVWKDIDFPIIIRTTGSRNYESK
jgi:hypothetical protein